MGVVVINGRTIEVRGNNISVINGSVYVDNKLVSEADQKIVNITITGNIETLNVDSCEQLTLNGDCNSLDLHTGNIKVKGNVSGNIEAHTGNISCGNVGGNCRTHIGNIIKNN